MVFLLLLDNELCAITYDAACKRYMPLVACDGQTDSGPTALDRALKARNRSAQGAGRASGRSPGFSRPKSKALKGRHRSGSLEACAALTGLEPGLAPIPGFRIPLSRDPPPWADLSRPCGAEAVRQSQSSYCQIIHNDINDCPSSPFKAPVESVAFLLMF